MMLRAVRADFALLAQYRYEPERLPLPVPITVLAGRQAGRTRSCPTKAWTAGRNAPSCHAAGMSSMAANLPSQPDRGRRRRGERHAVGRVRLMFQIRKVRHSGSSCSSCDLGR